MSSDINMKIKRTKMMFAISFTALMVVVFSNSWLLTGVSYGVSSPTTHLPTVKITSPHKGQQMPIGSNILVSGISSPPPGVSHTDCPVSLVLNGLKPYQKTVPSGPGGTTDYSIWHYNITPKYAIIKHGQNKITAKISCAASPSNLIKFNSVNVTGI